MKKYKKDLFTCTVCDEKGERNDFRIEVINGKKVNLCHNDCSEGQKGSEGVCPDIVFNQPAYKEMTPEDVYSSLNDWYKRFKIQEILSIRDILIEN